MSQGHFVRARSSVHLDRQTQTPGVENPSRVRLSCLPGSSIQGSLSAPRRFLDEDSRAETAAEGRPRNFYQWTWRLTFCSRRKTRIIAWVRTLEKCLIEINLRPSSEGTEKNMFSVLLPTLCLHGDWLEGRGSVSGWFVVGRVVVEPTARWLRVQSSPNLSKLNTI